ncbi:MAG: helix-turn-helix transcriptional regulator [Bacteroidetes bacterium]|nr:helix-turn-helix transcriptional regulator [Bacteroidota bacterium]
MLKLETKAKKKENLRYLELLGKRIRDLRKERNMTQKEMALRLGTNYIQIGRIERGQANSTIIMLKKVGDILEVEISELIKI